MHQSREWRYQEQRHAEDEMDFVDPGHVLQEGGSAGLEQQDAARPFGHDEHVGAFDVHQRYRNSRNADDELNINEQDDEEVRPFAGHVNARVGYPTVDEHRRSNEARRGKHASDDDRKDLLSFHAKA